MASSIWSYVSLDFDEILHRRLGPKTKIEFFRGSKIDNPLPILPQFFTPPVTNVQCECPNIAFRELIVAVMLHSHSRYSAYSEQEAQLLLGDRATRKHAKDS